MDSKLTFLFCLLIAFSIVNSTELGKECDRRFKEIIPIDDLYVNINKYGDTDLKDLFYKRNSNVPACLRFYKKLVLRFDEIFKKS
jgi:hypothetical protein